MSRERMGRHEIRGEEEKQTKKKRKRFSKFRFYFINILLGVCIFAILAVMVVYVLCTADTITVEGSTIYSDTEIETYVLDDSYCKNAVYATLKNFFQPKKDIPFVEKVSVSMDSYHSLKITVQEKKYVGCVPLSDGTYAYFDEDGIVVEVSERYVDGTMLIAGVTLEEAAVGSKVGLEKEQLNFLLILLKALKKYEIAITQLSFNESGEITVLYGSIAINVGTAENLEEKVMRLPHILPNLEGQTGTLHLEDWDQDHTDIVFEKPRE